MRWSQNFKLTGSCHVCKLPPLAWRDAGPVSLRILEQSNWTVYPDLAWITNQHEQIDGHFDSSVVHFMTLGLDRLGWRTQVVSASFHPRKPNFVRQFLVRLRECRVWCEGSKFAERQEWRISRVVAASSSPWDRDLRCPLARVSTTPSSSSSGRPLLRSNKEARLNPSLLGLHIFLLHNTLGSYQETGGKY